jgi:hypothetical protein
VTGPDHAVRAPVFVTYPVTLSLSRKGSRFRSCDSPRDREPQLVQQRIHPGQAPRTATPEPQEVPQLPGCGRVTVGEDDQFIMTIVMVVRPHAAPITSTSRAASTASRFTNPAR